MRVPSRRSGIVYLVGAGPGDPDLITRRGLQALWGADVVVYDRLVQRDLLSEAPDDALMHYVGKALGQPDPQSQINSLLVDAANTGATVVRLKGGDPFVFGRGGEEAAALRAAGVAFEVVPGVSSAIAAAAFAGIPVTQRGVSSSFAVITGHQVTDMLDPSAVARVDTIVLLMGVGHLSAATEALMAAGRPADDPAALVESASLPHQRVLRSTLGQIARDAAAFGAIAPATVVIGATAALADDLAWFEPDEARLAPSFRDQSA